MKKFLVAVLGGLLLVTASASADVIGTTPQHRWLMDETSGSTIVDSGTVQTDGTYTGGVNLGLSGATPSSMAAGFWSSEGPGTGFIPHDESMEMSSGVIGFFFKDTGSIRDVGLFAKDHDGYGDGGHLSIVIRDGYVQARLQSTSESYWLTALNPVALDEWYHVTVTFGELGFNLLIDGELQDSNAYTGGLEGNTSPIVLGAESWLRKPGELGPLGGQFSGVLDDIYVTHLPEPASLALLAMGGVMMLGRRRAAS